MGKLQRKQDVPGMKTSGGLKVMPEHFLDPEGVPESM